MNDKEQKSYYNGILDPLISLYDYILQIWGEETAREICFNTIHRLNLPEEDWWQILALAEGHEPVHKEIEEYIESLHQNMCPEFPYFGASYPDARCVDGVLYDLDNCDENGNLYEPTEQIPCPFCRPEDYKKYFDMSDEEFDAFITPLREKYCKQTEKQ